MTTAASLFVAVITLLNIAGVVWLLWWTSKRRGAPTSEVQTTGHVWDDDLREYDNPLPRWWMGLFLLTVVFGLVYLALYPGLGNFAGLRGWTEAGQHQEQSRQAEAVLARTFAPFEKESVAALAHDRAAVQIGRNLFLQNCVGCHGSDARGAPGFPNLTDKDWLWGGDPDTILTSIRGGRTGVMIGWLPMLGASGVEDVLAYVLNLSGHQLPAGVSVEAGKQKFGEVCAACHGADAHGNQQLGAPNLTDAIWLHGGSISAIRETIAHGRDGQMPAHLELLGETRTKLLAAYVISLGGATESPTPAVAAAPPPAANGQ
jgi:cytochrome c oxidase cbb3-type subunit III